MSRNANKQAAFYPGGGQLTVDAIAMQLNQITGAAGSRISLLRIDPNAMADVTGSSGKVTIIEYNDHLADLRSQLSDVASKINEILAVLQGR